MGSFPPGWVSTTLGELVQPRRETVQARTNGGRYLGLEHVEPHTTRITGTVDSASIKGTGVRFRASDTLYSRLRPYLNKTCVPDFDGVASSEYIVLPAVDWLTPRFLMYFLHQPNVVAFANARSTGTHRPRVKWDDLADFPIGFPPLAEQRRIVAAIEEHFSRVEAGVEVLQRARRNLQRMRAAVLQAAVTGRLVPQDSKDEPAKLLLDRIVAGRKKVFSSNEDSTSLPPNWCSVTPNQIIAPTPNALTIGPFGSDLKVSDYRDKGVPLVFVRNVRTAEFTGPRTKYVSPEKARELSTHTALPGDVLVTKMGDPPGDACVYPNGCPPAIITADIIKMTLHAEVNPIFVALAVNSPQVKQQILQITKGVAQQKVSLARFRTEVVLPLPPVAEQLRIVEEVERQLSLLTSLDSALIDSQRRCIQLRQSILTRAFDGGLVPQDSFDEPADALLGRVKASLNAENARALRLSKRSR